MRVMTDIFKTWIEIDDQEHEVEVEYRFEPPRRATRWEPAEGGVFIEGVYCSTCGDLSAQLELIEQRCADHAWQEYRALRVELEAAKYDDRRWY